ncbi:DUF2264 domain-containing protein [Pedobacter sp.]|uniref:DUF2264 domain-containing protein n=1 Tax=Pedobacter sp. TaxID=1411316 RepID=UPI003D7F9216
MRIIAFIFLMTGVTCFAQAQNPSSDNNNKVAQAERSYLVNSLVKIADPVLVALSKNELKKTMPVECVEGALEGRKQVTYLEAFGRLLSGMAPWLELGADDTPEGKLRQKYIRLALKGLDNATNPKAADYMNFNKGGQPLVDAAFLAQALLRAPTQLWDPLDQQTKTNIIRELKSSRVIRPYTSNWLLFSAMVEAALLKFDGAADQMRIDYAVKQHMQWYKGDGAYGDGENFHWDYYNSFVIQPMLIEILETTGNEKKLYAEVLRRATRYSGVQERLISPDGTYPPIGRSLAYRFGAFQSLAQMALLKKLPSEVKPQQVRAALYTVIKKQLEAPGTFDEKGWLQIGFYGHQPSIGESYISTGSLYLCSQGFLILGLTPTDELWTGADEDWTQRKIWNGHAIPIDHSIDN